MKLDRGRFVGALARGVVACLQPAMRMWAQVRPVVVDGQRLDAGAQSWLAIANLPGMPRLESRSPQAARKRLQGLGRWLEVPPADVFQVEELQVDGAAGPLSARLYRPDGNSAPAPALVYFHGGGRGARCARGRGEIADELKRGLHRFSCERSS